MRTITRSVGSRAIKQSPANAATRTSYVGPHGGEQYGKYSRREPRPVKDVCVICGERDLSAGRGRRPGRGGRLRGRSRTPGSRRTARRGRNGWKGLAPPPPPPSRWGG